MSELPGQMALFRSPYAVTVYVGERHEPIVEYQVTETWQDCEPLCDECGTACTSSKECVEISGLYDEDGLET